MFQYSTGCVVMSPADLAFNHFMDRSIYITSGYEIYKFQKMLIAFLSSLEAAGSQPQLFAGSPHGELAAWALRLPASALQFTRRLGDPKTTYHQANHVKAEL